MSSCCEGKCDALVELRKRQASVLKIVLVVNAVMFVVEVCAGLAAGSTSVLADSLDMFGDAVVYATSLYVLDRGRIWQARMAAVKGFIMLVFGGGVLVQACLRAAGLAAPNAEAMGVVGIAALVANLGCLYLLTRHRNDDINMQSVWVCSRNDIVANVGVLAAAGAVALFHSRWPDVVIGVAIAVVFLVSAVRVVRAALRQLREEPEPLEA